MQPLAIDDVELVPPAPGTNLPPRAFTSPAIFEAEQRAVFARSWVHVCDACDLPERGSFVAATIGKTPVLIVRDRTTGALRGFLNACRHRGAQLLDGKGTCDKQIKCPYHAWSYGLDGRLLGVPYREQFCDVSDMSLVPVRVGEVGPLVFACLDADAPDLATWVGDLAPELARAQVATWKLAFDMTYELDANWKLFVENANDGYHVQFVHDLLTDAIVIDSAVATLEAHSAYTWADVNPSYVPPGEDPAQAKVRFGCIFPNLIPVLSSVDFTYLRVDPLGLDRLRVVARSYDHGDDEGMREFRRIALDRTTQQDMAVVRRTQQGLHAVGLPAGVHSNKLEDRIGHFERMWARAMARHHAERLPKRHLAVAF